MNSITYITTTTTATTKLAVGMKYQISISYLLHTAFSQHLHGIIATVTRLLDVDIIDLMVKSFPSFIITV
jgi:hypothetical protein